MKTVLNDYVSTVENELKKYIPHENNDAQSVLSQSMEYSLLSGGKRIRPILLMEFYRLCGGKNVNDVLSFACALEMIHTYSLIHDDLPCMDDDDMRRGRPSNHVAFGESTALLSGDALLNLAFETMLDSKNLRKIPAERIIKAAGTLGKCSGFYGMIGGQVIDLQIEGKKVELDILKNMDLKKTGALIKAACVMGCILAGADEKIIELATSFAENLGLAFQIVDDILDVTADEKVLGKPTHSDQSNNKSTYVSILGLEKSKDLAKGLTDKAINSLKKMNLNTEFLENLTLSLLVRVN